MDGSGFGEGIGGLGWIFPALAFVTWIAVPTYAALARGRLYASFAGILLTISLPAALVLHATSTAAEIGRITRKQWSNEKGLHILWALMISPVQQFHKPKKPHRVSSYDDSPRST